MNPSMAVFFLAAALAASAAHGAPPSPYAGEERRAIKALGTDQVQALLEGRGMGMAKAAELNGYPGPRHVLDLQDALGLTDRQRERTRALFESMQARARELGRALVEAERELDRSFASARITPALLASSVQRIGALQGELRAVHLQAHLQQARLLTPEQIARYAQLRGYGRGAGGEHGNGHEHSRGH